MDARDAHETIRETATQHGNRRIALLIAVMAALLALMEMAGNNAENEALERNVEAANLWAFFQAKTIRQTTLRTNAELLETLGASPERSEEVAKRVAAWRATADRYETEPSTNEGRRELAARAKAAEQRRDQAHAANDVFELGSAALQIGIVVASASVIAGVTWLAWLALGLAGAGLCFGLLGWFAPGAALYF